MMHGHTAKYSIRTDPVVLGHARQFRVLRKVWGMTLKDVAQRVGTSVQTISLLENHPELVSSRMWNKIAEVFGFPKYTPPASLTAPENRPIRVPRGISDDSEAVKNAHEVYMQTVGSTVTQCDLAVKYGVRQWVISCLGCHPERVSPQMWNHIARQAGYPEYCPPSGGNEQEGERAISEEPQGVYLPRKDYEDCLKVMKALVKFLECQGGGVKDERKEDA